MSVQDLYELHNYWINLMSFNSRSIIVIIGHYAFSPTLPTDAKITVSTKFLSDANIFQRHGHLHRSESNNCFLTLWIHFAEYPNAV